MKKIVVKIGTNVLTNEKETLDVAIINSLVDQIIKLRKREYNIILVSSGAVGAGKSFYLNIDNNACLLDRQSLAAIGQVELMRHYKSIFAKKNKLCGQLLVTKEDFRDRNHYLNMKSCFETLLENDVVPIVNENDVISHSGFMRFTDNDELAGLIATMMDAERVIILSTVDGLFTGDPNDTKSRLIANVVPSESDLSKYITNKTSSSGTGGMETKVRVASKLASVGIESIIANGKTENILVDLIDQEPRCTKFKPLKTVSNLKRWIAYSKGFEEGDIRVNEGAKKILQKDSQIASLLPIGIINVSGHFQKGDIVKISDEKGKQFAIGLSNFDVDTVREKIGKHNERVIVHYNNMVIL